MQTNEWINTLIPQQKIVVKETKKGIAEHENYFIDTVEKITSNKIIIKKNISFCKKTGIYEYNANTGIHISYELLPYTKEFQKKAKTAPLMTAIDLLTSGGIS